MPGRHIPFDRIDRIFDRAHGLPIGIEAAAKSEDCRRLSDLQFVQFDPSANNPIRYEMREVGLHPICRRPAIRICRNQQTARADYFSAKIHRGTAS
ncbi:hypothetical protein AX777_16380 [Sphingobium yanoikuyae]|uniref:Uncharacterized protein n=1 Tax=Sphingobium yanoikuyae TaxID=13690 RepID=A0A177K4I6_SPHYA|nr:hypothetical protein AX777_16380 [Sphingobium yanoikuyae]